MINKIRVYVCMILALFVVAGCSGTSKADYSKIIDSALKANKELVSEQNWEKKYSEFDRKNSNIMIWEDGNNYYVYLRKNVENAYVTGDGYKIDKNMDKWSSSPADRAKIKDFLDDNKEPVYKENNVTLVSDDLDMR
ncbi:hypothetical protein E5K21_002330 [Enterococcus faecalis]|uniref:hypothetical protein n=1 Tax=Enterococcus faecalis TaxID=1351 RepID=UPI0019DDB82F|nr:hypothetical protein [Enterococcus faecalis]EGO8197145.1 hypothetical protein [Enterococcus faecalis]MBX8942275.1 hypothetical protein [Enterococcus faecalis]